MDESFDETASAVAPQPLNAQGNSYSLDGGVWDAFDIKPSVDALVGFDRAPNTNEAPIPGGVTSTFKVRAREIYYRLPSGTTAGTIQIRGYRWRRS